MARFDVYRNKGGASPPLLLQIQSALHDDLSGRVMVPLVPSRLAEGRRPSRLMPEFEIEGEYYTMVTQELASIPKRRLGEEVISLEDQRYDIIGAVDFLFQGF